MENKQRSKGDQYVWLDKLLSPEQSEHIPSKNQKLKSLLNLGTRRIIQENKEDLGGFVN